MQQQPARGYQAFGSFFSDNVEDMVRSSSDVPDPASVVPDADLVPPAPAELGAAARKHFLVDFGTWTFLNHGAFGRVCTPRRRARLFQR